MIPVYGQGVRGCVVLIGAKFPERYLQMISPVQVKSLKDLRVWCVPLPLPDVGSSHEGNGSCVYRPDRSGLIKGSCQGTTEHVGSMKMGLWASTRGSRLQIFWGRILGLLSR